VPFERSYGRLTLRPSHRTTPSLANLPSPAARCVAPLTDLLRLPYRGVRCMRLTHGRPHPKIGYPSNDCRRASQSSQILKFERGHFLESAEGCENNNNNRWELSCARGRGSERVSFVHSLRLGGCAVGLRDRHLQSLEQVRSRLPVDRPFSCSRRRWLSGVVHRAGGADSNGAGGHPS
jgi:hypothetical protein